MVRAARTRTLVRTESKVQAAAEEAANLEKKAKVAAEAATVVQEEAKRTVAKAKVLPTSSYHFYMLKLLRSRYRKFGCPVYFTHYCITHRSDLWQHNLIHSTYAVTYKNRDPEYLFVSGKWYMKWAVSTGSVACTTTEPKILLQKCAELLISHVHRYRGDLKMWRLELQRWDRKALLIQFKPCHNNASCHTCISNLWCEACTLHLLSFK